MKKRFINKRKNFFFSINSTLFLLLFIVLILIYYLYTNYNKIIFLTNDIIEIYSSKFNYNLSKIEIEGLHNLSKQEILKHFKDYEGKSIFLVPINEISKKINQNTWFKKIKIKNDYKNTLKVTVEEEIPLGLYDNGNKKILFSKEFVVLEIITNASKYKDFITIRGLNALNNAKNLFENLDENYLNDIDSATFIENRRWNLELKNNLILKLPEENIYEAL